MSLADLAGRSFERTGPVRVTEERLTEFAQAVGSSYVAGTPAPPTFPIVVAFAAIRELVEHPDAGLSLAGLVHGEQRFAFERPVTPGDELTAELTVESVRSMGEAAWLRTRSDIRDQSGDLVVTAWATLIHRQPNGPAADGPVTPPTPRSSS